MSLTIISPLLTAIAQSFSVKIAQVGILFTAQFIGFVVFILIGGVIADRWGKKIVLSISLIGFTVVILVFPSVHNFNLACLIMIFIGGFGGIIESITSALVSDMNASNKSFYINLVQVFFGFGALIGPIVAGILLSQGVSWKICYYGLGILSFILTIVFIVNKFPNLSSPDKITVNDFKLLIADKRFLFVCMCMAFYTGSEVGGWGWLCTFLDQSMGFTVTKSSVAVAVFWTAMTLGRILCGGLTFKYTVRSIVVMLAFASSAVTLLSVFVSNEFAIWAVIAAMGISYSSQWPFIAAYGSTHSNAPSGTVFALLIASGGIGSMIIPYSMGVVGEIVNMRAAMIIPTGLLFIVAGTFVVFGRKDIDKKMVNEKLQRI